MVLPGFYEGLLVLPYFGSATIMLTADPNVEARGLNSALAAHGRGRLELRSFATLKEEPEPRGRQQR